VQSIYNAEKKQAQKSAMHAKTLERHSNIHDFPLGNQTFYITLIRNNIVYLSTYGFFQLIAKQTLQNKINAATDIRNKNPEQR